MAKSKPIGVRFDLEMLNTFKEDKIADSPQKALNYLTWFYSKYKAGREGNIDFVEKFAESSIFSKEKKEPDPKKWYDEKTVKMYDDFESKKTKELGVKIDKQRQTEILAQITQIKSQKIPKERDTRLGRPIWASDQQKRIAELQKQLIDK